MHKLFFATALAVLSACAVPTTYRDGVTIVGASDGGFVEPVAQIVNAMYERGETVRIPDLPDLNHCWSACTLYLKVAECVGPTRQFGFHAAMHAGLFLAERETRLIATYYPGDLRHWYLHQGGNRYDPTGIVPLSGVQVSQLTGIPLCEPGGGKPDKVSV